MNKFLRFRLVCVFALLVCTVPTGSVSSVNLGEWKREGIRVGLNIANMSGDEENDVDFDPIIRPQLGIILQNQVNDQLILQIEFLVSMKGIAREYRKPVFRGFLDVTEKIEFIYLEVPVLLKFPFTDAHDRGLSIYFGPQAAVSLWTGTSGDIAVTGNTSLESISFDHSVNNERLFDFGIVFGLDMKLPWRHKHLTLDLRYTEGLRTVFGDPIFDANSDAISIVDPIDGRTEASRHGVLAISVGIGL